MELEHKDETIRELQKQLDRNVRKRDDKEQTKKEQKE